MKFLIINGPNLNMLGIREPEVYGKTTYSELCETVRAHCEKKHIESEFFQSNHEGALVDELQRAYRRIDGIIINPAAFTHTSIALLDAVKAIGLPVVEVHLSDVTKREDFRQVSYIRSACIATVMGKGIDGYIEAVDILTEHITADKGK